MHERCRKILLVVNYVGVAFFALGALFTVMAVDLAAAGRVTELDRAEVFREDKLKEFDEEYGTNLATNLRYYVSRWITEPARTNAKRYGYLGIGFSVCNVIVLHVAKPRSRRDQTTD